MHRTMLLAKLHRACVTHTELEYEGSCAIDSDLLDAAGIRGYEQIQIYNLANGERLTTYAIGAQRGSRIVSMNGAAAYKGAPGDRIIICAYAAVDEQALDRHKPTLVYLDAANRIEETRHAIPTQVA